VTTSSAIVMDDCPGCGAHLYGTGNFCTSCGTALTLAHSQAQPLIFDSPPRRVEVVPPLLLPPSELRANPHQIAARGVAQSFSLEPRIAMAVVGTDLMVNAVETLTLGLLIVLSLLAAIPLGIITYKGQRKFAGDDHETALIKGLIVGLLSGIPGPLPYLLFVPAGIVGFFRRKSS
jgi:hypothetical protein